MKIKNVYYQIIYIHRYLWLDALWTEIMNITTILIIVILIITLIYIYIYIYDFGIFLLVLLLISIVLYIQNEFNSKINEIKYYIYNICS